MTVLGKHTLAETRDLMKVVQYRFDQVDKGFNAIPQTWITANPDAYQKLQADWNAEKAKWKATSTSVGAKLLLYNMNLVPADLIATEDEYKQILGFVEYGANSGVDRTPGDLRDDQDRIELALGHAIDLSGRPNINTNDPDMKVYNTLDNAIKQGEAAAAETKKAAANALTSNTGLLLLAGAGIALAGVVAVKVYL